MADPGYSTLFRQSDFTGGLNAKLDAAKLATNAYPLLINGRTRKNVVSPTAKHVLLDAPLGKKQGLYISGSFILLFVAGVAYYGDATENPIIFRQVGGWVAMDATVDRIYAELVPATSNLFNRQGTPDNTTRIFNDALAIFEQTVFCFDGALAQGVVPPGIAVPLGSYATWTKNNPLYVPGGVLPAFASNKLFLVTTDRHRILHSVSGRCSDFVVNLDTNGDKGGTPETTSQTVSFNNITALRSLSTGEVLVGTLYGTHILVLDYDHPIFGEPYLRPEFLFPAGPINEISIVDVTSDTAFITQSGIHKFNAVMQAKRESNNAPFGAQIRGLLTDPTTERAIIQSGTCAGIFDDYALFAINTIYGYGTMIYDTTTESFHSFDTSFGRVKQFASTRITGVERLFFITHDDKVYEAFAGTEKNTTRILLGEWTPAEAPADSLTYMVDMVFTNVKTSGHVKISIYADNHLRTSVVQAVNADDRTVSLPIDVPYQQGLKIIKTGFHFPAHYRAWKFAAMVEWDFAGNLTDFSVDGKTETGDNVRFELPSIANTQDFYFISDSVAPTELNVGGTFDANGLRIISVTAGDYYIFRTPSSEISLVNGQNVITFGEFKAASITLAINGPASGAADFSLVPRTPYHDVLKAIDNESSITAILHGGDFSDGSEASVEIGLLPIHYPFNPAPGNHDIINSNGEYFFGRCEIPRYYHKAFSYVDIFFFDGNHTTPDGYNSSSLQAAAVKNWIAQSSKRFKILIVHQPPYTNEIVHSTGDPDLRYLIGLPGLSAILSGHSHVMERIITNGFPSFTCGTAGQTLRTFVPNTTSAFRRSGVYGYLKIHSDPVSCTFEFKDTSGNTLDTYAIYQ